MKDETGVKPEKREAGLGEKSEIKANAGIKVKDENRSKTGKSGAGLGKSEIRANAGIRGGRKRE